jgi:hypothetical protein
MASGGSLSQETEALRARLEEPLRIAIAGRVNAGKSTLLNSLVGERIAATDATECTRIVTWYRYGNSYDVSEIDRSGIVSERSFHRVEGKLELDLTGLDAADVTRLDVAWPSNALRRLTLIDTPGLVSHDDTNSMRTREFLASDHERASDADAVIYLMHHVHRSDVEFLDSFLDRAIAGTSPVNAVAVLSRADEIGAGRLDALESAQRIASRYAADPVIRTLCATVIPLVGLLAETGQTLREDEAGALRTIAATPRDLRDPMLWSTDGFCRPDISDVTVARRQALLERLGLFGLRVVIDAIDAGRVGSAADMSRLLVDVSGLAALRTFIDEVFVAQTDVLKARAVLTSLRGLAKRLAMADPGQGRRLETEIERAEAETAEFAQLRLVHLVRSGLVLFSDEEQAELDELTARNGQGGTNLDVAAALAGIERWRTRASNPRNDPTTVEASEAMARIYEQAYVQRSGRA